MLIQNETIKNLLEKKIEIITKGRELNVVIEEKAEPIATKFLEDRGVKVSGDSEVTFGADKKYKLYSGTYNALQNAFKDSSAQVLQEEIGKELEDELNELKALELQVNKINEEVSSIVTKEIMPTLELGETETVTNIELRGIDIELTIIDVVEEYKQKYLASIHQEATQANPSDLNTKEV